MFTADKYCMRSYTCTYTYVYIATISKVIIIVTLDDMQVTQLHRWENSKRG